jgi:epoxyqueuosine reductase
MEYLARNAELRVDPAKALPGSRSVIMVADVYQSRAAAPAQPAPDAARPVGAIARYARGLDYHKVMKRRLHALCDALRERFLDHRFRAFVDTAPLPERELAARAGLGWIGKNTLLINPRLGSYTLLGGVLTTLALDSPPHEEPDHCGSCTRCIDACPTRALTPYSLDASRCISYLTIEHRGEIAPEFHAAIGSRVFGCDVCQEVCPHNSPRDAGEPARDEYAPRRTSLDLLSVLGWTESDRGEALRGSSLKRATLAMLQRNARIALGNSPAPGPDTRETMSPCADATPCSTPGRTCAG